MKKIIIIFAVLECLAIIFPTSFLGCTSYSANDSSANSIENDGTNEIINNQKDNLKISDFIKESEKYTKESMPGVNLNDLLSTAISGNVDNVRFIRLFWSLLRKRSFKFSRGVKQYYCYCGNSWNSKKHNRWP